MKLRIHILALIFTALSLPLAAQDHLHGFGPPVVWGAALTTGTTQAFTADVNGDKLDDIVLVFRGGVADGDVYVMLNLGGSFGAQTLWADNLVLPTDTPVFADFDGDGDADCALVEQLPGGALGSVYVARSNGSAFIAAGLWQNGFAYENEVIRTGDIDGDGRADLLTFTRGASADVYAVLSNGAAFVGISTWHSNFCPGTAVPAVADVDGDGKADIIAFHRADPLRLGDVQVALAQNGHFDPTPFGVQWHSDFAYSFDTPAVGDVNGDGRADILMFQPDTGDVYAAVSTGAAFTGTNRRYHTDLASGDDRPLVGRFDGDCNADVAAVKPSVIPPGGFVPVAGNVLVARAGGHAVQVPVTPADFGSNTWSVPMSQTGAGVVRRPLLVLLTQYQNITPFPEPLMTVRDLVKARYFGPEQANVAAHYLEMSGGEFTWKPAPGSSAFNGNAVPPVDGVTAVVTTLNNLGVATDWPALLRAAAQQGVEFRAFDKDGDGVVEPEELTIIEVNNGVGGTTGTPIDTTFPDGGAVPGNVHVVTTACTNGSPYNPLSYFNASHEISHTFGTPDFYNPNGGALAGQSLLGGGGANNIIHLGAWERMKAGWFTPRAFDVTQQYPGYTTVKSAQRADWTTGTPLAFFSSARQAVGLGVHEYYLVEARARTAPSTSDFLTGGYDSFAGGTGGLFWCVYTDLLSHAAGIEQMIARGSDGVFDSTAHPNDQIIGTAPFDYITSGPDFIADTVPVAGDINYNVPTVFPTTSPDAWPDRGGYNSNGNGWKFWNSTDFVINPRWRDSSPMGPLFRVSDGTDGVLGVQWQYGGNFIPFVDSASAPANAIAHRPGEWLTISGGLGVDIHTPRLTRRRAGSMTEYILPVQNWAGSSVQVQIPASLPSGTYPVFFRRLSITGPISNSIKLTVSNPYLDWILAFLPGQENNPAVSDPNADFDLDGVPNGVEFVMNSNPLDSRDGPQRYTVSRNTNGHPSLTWNEYIPHLATATLSAEGTRDLTIPWTVLGPGIQVGTFGLYRTFQASLPSDEPHYFFRLRAVSY